MARADRRHPVGGEDEAVDRANATAPNPVWFKPVMAAFMIIGLVWIIVTYLTGMQFPIPGIAGFNLVVGFGIAFIGFLMTTRWR